MPYNKARHSIDADRVPIRKDSKDNLKVIEFTRVATMLGISYGELQQRETIATIAGKGRDFELWLQRCINN